MKGYGTFEYLNKWVKINYSFPVSELMLIYVLKQTACPLDNSSPTSVISLHMMWTFLHCYILVYMHCWLFGHSQEVLYAVPSYIDSEPNSWLTSTRPWLCTHPLGCQEGEVGSSLCWIPPQPTRHSVAIMNNTATTSAQLHWQLSGKQVPHM